MMWLLQQRQRLRLRLRQQQQLLAIRAVAQTCCRLRSGTG
jgi:hypothetical protein